VNTDYSVKAGGVLTAQDSQQRIRRALFALAFVLIAIDLAAVCMRRERHRGDFDVSREFGRRFLAGEYLYRGGLHFPYLPSAAMYFSPLAALPAAVAFVASYCLALVCLWLTFRMLHAMICSRSVRLEPQGLFIAAAAIVLGIHYLIRDLDDGGPNIILLAIIVAGIHAVWKGRAGIGATWLGIAIAIKVMPSVFVPYFAWKRNWRLAIYTAASAAFWIMLPMVRMGPSSWWLHLREWADSAIGFALGRNAAAEFYYGANTIQNQSLRAAIVHLMTKNPVTAPIAGATAVAAVAMLVLAFCRLVPRCRVRLDDPALPVESGGLLVMALLLSPITWVQHMVLMIPALYLIAAAIGIKRLGRTAAGAMILFAVLTLLLNRTFAGAQGYRLFLDYHVHTLGMLIVLGVVMLRMPSALRDNENSALERLCPAGSSAAPSHSALAGTHAASPASGAPASAAAAVVRMHRDACH
jgi:alpha-1,2-mannosyltransferase